MGKNAISIIQEGNKVLDELNDKLKITMENIIAINDAALKIKKNSFNIKTPKELNNNLKENNEYIQKINANLKEKERIERAIIAQEARKKQAISDLNKQLSQERFETQQLNKQAKEAAILSSKLSSEYQKQSVRLNKLRREYKDVALVQGESSKQAKRLRSEITTLDNRLKRVDANVGQFQRSVGNYGKAMRGAVGAARSLAGAMGLLGGAFLVVRVFRDAFQRIREFDKEMQNMAGILRTTRPELEQLESKIISVAASSIKTSNEVAKLATSLLVLGKSKEDVLQLLEPVNNLSIALGATSDETGEFLVQTLNAFGKGSESALKFADTIAAIRTSTSLDFQRMRDSFQYITPISKILNKDLAYTGAIVGVLADNGLKAEQAGRLLATAQIKLATSGKTLQEGLDEINDAYKEGKTGIELLTIANKNFGKQAAKIGVVLATNQEKIKEYDERIRQASGSLDDLVNEQLKSVDAQLDITTSTWEEFVLSVENGEGSISTVISSILGFINDTIKGFTLLNKTTKEYFEYLQNDVSKDTFKEVTKAYLKMGDDAEKLAIKEADRSRDKIEQLEAEKKKIEEVNKAIEDSRKTFTGGFKQGLEKLSGLIFPGTSIGDENKIKENNKRLEEISASLGYYNGVLEASENIIVSTDDTQKSLNSTNKEAENTNIKTIASLREKIKAERERIEGLDLENETERASLELGKKNIENWQNEINAILGLNNARKQGVEAIKGSLAFMEQEISKLEEKQSKLAKNSQEYFDYEVAIRKAKVAVKDFREEVDLLLLDLDGVSVLNATGDFQKAYEKIKEIIKGAKLGETGKPIIQGLENSGLDDIEKNLREQQELEIKIYTETAEKKKQLERDFQDSVISITNSIFEAKVMRYEEDIQKNNDYYSVLLDNQQLSEEQRSAIEAERDRKNAELEKKKREIQIKQAKYEKLFAIAQIGIDTTKQVAAISAQVALLTAKAALNPLFAPLIPVAASQIPVVIASGALAAATVAARPIPKYEKGKGEYDSYEGPAIWGEKRREAKISKDGSIEFSPKKIGNHLTTVKKDDIIHPDASKFISSLTDEQLYNDIHKYSILASMNSQTNAINSLLIEKSINNQTGRLIKALSEKNKTNINIKQNIDLSGDLDYLLRKQNTL